MNLFIFLFEVFTLVCLTKSEVVLDVTKFGADLTAATKSSDAIKKAIEEVNGKGGGTVFFPVGQYLSGPIHLKSNVTLQFADGTVLKFTNDFDDYLPMVKTRWEGTEFINFSPLIYSYKQENIAIKGKALLDGQGIGWWEMRAKLIDEYRQNGTRNSKYQKEFLRLNNLTEIATETMDMTRIDLAFLRPPFIQPFDTKNILIEDISMKDSPFWNINPVYCENVTIRGVRIDAPYPNKIALNTDGIDVDSCKDVFITENEFKVGDDCIAIKSGRDKQARRINRPTVNVLITNCKMLGGMGGVSIGSEQSAGVSNVTVKDCIFDNTDRGLFIKSERGRGGIVQNILYQNISMTRIKYEAIRLTMHITHNKTTPEPFSERTPVFRNIKFEDIRAEAHTSVSMSGLQESLLEDIELNNVKIVSNTGLTGNYTKYLKITGYSNNITK